MAVYAAETAVKKAESELAEAKIVETQVNKSTVSAEEREEVKAARLLTAGVLTRARSDLWLARESYAAARKGAESHGFSNSAHSHSLLRALRNQLNAPSK